VSLLQYSDKVRSVQLNATVYAVGVRPRLELRSGPRPASCAARDLGKLLCAIELPHPWMQGAEGGEMVKCGDWSGTAVAAGDAGHFRLKDSTGVTHMQGVITEPDGGGTIELDDVALEKGDTVTVGTFVIEAGNR
jgi:hypothetical protein